MRKFKHDLAFYALHIVMIGAACFWLYPYAWMILSSLKPNSDIFTTSLFGGHLSFDNYKFLLATSEKLHRPFVRAFFNSLGVSATVTLCVVITSSYIAYGLAKVKFFGREAINGFLIFQMVFPSFMFIVPLFILTKNLGLINTYAAMILPSIMSGWGIFMLVQSYKGTPAEYVEAAVIDGAGIFWIIYKIMVPLNKGILAIVALNTFVGIWDNFMWPLIVMKDFDRMPLSVLLALFNKEFTGLYLGPTIAGAVLQTLPMIILFICFRKAFLKGIAVSLK